MKTAKGIITEHYSCTCDQIYTCRKMIDPSCTYHEHGGEIELMMDEWAKQTAIDVINFLKRQGVNWNINNASTLAEELFDLYQQEKSSLK